MYKSFKYLLFFIKSLALIEDDLKVRKKALKILQFLSKDPANCNKMLSAECAHRIVLKMNTPQSNEEFVSHF